MASLLEKSEQALPITEMARSAKKIIDDFQKGEQNKYVVMRNNIPAAVIMSISHYELLINQIEELYDELTVIQRLKSFNSDKLISHEKMIDKFTLDS